MKTEIEIVSDSCDRIKKAREDMGWPQVYLADKININPPTYSRWESGKIEAVPRAIWLQLSELLGCSITWLQGYGSDDDRYVRAIHTIPQFDMTTGAETLVNADPGLQSVISVRLDDSMARLYPAGAIAWVKQVSDPEHGQLVAVRTTHGDILVRRFERYGTIRVLRPESMDPIAACMIMNPGSKTEMLGQVVRITIDI